MLRVRSSEAAGGRAAAVPEPSPRRRASLQDRVGNRGTLHLLRDLAARGLPVSAPHDREERAADAAAARVERAPAAAEEAPVGRRAAPSTEAAPAALGDLGPGRPLDGAARAFFEPRLGADLGSVRVHHDARSARALHARAYAVGEHVVLRDGAPDRALLAHELAHVVRSRGEGPRIARQHDDDDLDAGTDDAGPQDGGIRAPRAAAGAPPVVQQILDAMYETPADQSAGVGHPEEAIRLLDAMPMSQLIDTQVWLRASGSPIGGPPLRIEAAEVAAELQPQTRPFTAATLARLRDITADVNAADRAAIIAFIPEAQSPTVTVSDADATPPSGSPYASWPAPLLRTVARSFLERQAVTAHSGDNLANSFWGGNPTTPWAALDLFAAADRATMLANYNRAVAAGFPWSAVRSVGHAWTGTSAGMAFVPEDEGAIRAALSASPRFCHDSWLSGSEHPDAECWREVVLNAAGIHICLGGVTSSSMHIDAHQVVNGRDSDGTCDINYLGSAGFAHGHDLGWF